MLRVWFADNRHKATETDIFLFSGILKASEDQIRMRLYELFHRDEERHNSNSDGVKWSAIGFDNNNNGPITRPFQQVQFNQADAAAEYSRKQPEAWQEHTGDERGIPEPVDLGAQVQLDPSFESSVHSRKTHETLPVASALAFGVKNNLTNDGSKPSSCTGTSGSLGYTTSQPFFSTSLSSKGVVFQEALVTNASRLLDVAYTDSEMHYQSNSLAQRPSVPSPVLRVTITPSLCAAKRVLPEVKNWHERLRKLVSGDNSTTGNILHLIKHHLL